MNNIELKSVAGHADYVVPIYESNRPLFQHIMGYITATKKEVLEKLLVFEAHNCQIVWPQEKQDSEKA